MDFPYAQSGATFAACRPLADHTFAFAGVPFDGAVTNRPGARYGPLAIRQASQMLCDAIHPGFDLSPIAKLGDAGNLSLPNASGLAPAREAICTQAGALMAKHHLVCAGGDHAITLGLVQAAYQRYGPLAMVHFDAHCDTWNDHFGEPSGHGTWVREAIEQGCIDCTKTVQVGLRSSGERKARDYVSERGGLIYTARDLRGLDGAGLNSIINSIYQQLGDTPCYLTLDIDCLDPAFAPGTGTPEPGGLSSSQLLTFIEELWRLNFVAMDCVEVAPAYDHAELTSLAGATIVLEYLYVIAAGRRAAD